MTCTEAQQLMPAHALDALDGDEARQLAGHLASCQTCRAELAAFQEATYHLAATVPAASPSPDLRRRILATATSQRAGPLARGRSWWHRLWTSSGRLSPVVALAALLIALGTSLWAVNEQVELSRQMAANRLLAEQVAAQEQLVAALLAPGLQQRELRAEATAPGARAVLFVNAQSNAALLTADGLPQLPSDRVYQLWLIQDGRRTSGGTFGVDANGNSRLAISAPQPLGSYQAVGVTIEPTGGSPGPTGARVLAGTL